MCQNANDDDAMLASLFARSCTWSRHDTVPKHGVILSDVKDRLYMLNNNLHQLQHLTHKTSIV